MKPLLDVKEKVPSVPEFPVKVSPPPSGIEASAKPIVILSELDSYIAERMKGQPPTLEEATARVQLMSDRPRHRLKLPLYFEKFSADNQKAPGAYVFRWVFKQKRAIDVAMSIGWIIVNRTHFQDAPAYLFTANGGVEVGDALLALMPLKKAQVIRDAPGQRSRERLKGQMTQTKPDYVMMTGNVKSDHVYEPELGPEQIETSAEKVPGVLTEGRDF